jgi:hypothetical protein
MIESDHVRIFRAWSWRACVQPLLISLIHASQPQSAFLPVSAQSTALNHRLVGVSSTAQADDVRSATMMD